MKLTFLGSGNIARAIIGGLVANGTSPASITAADPMPAALAEAEKMGVNTSSNNSQAIDDADVVLISVKPNVVRELATEIETTVGERLVVSVAAGITTSSLRSWLGPAPAIIRCMPNTPALVQSGITGLFAATGVRDEQRVIAGDIMSAVGSVIWVDKETELDAVTAISGSGPAYFFYVMEAMQEAAISLGLDAEVARKLVVETALGAAKIVHLNEEGLEEHRRRVTSPGGTTEAAIQSLADNDLKGIFAEAISKAHTRSMELAREN